MKRIFLILLVVVLLFCFVGENSLKGDTGNSEGRLMVTASGNILSFADDSFKEIYSSSIFYPELKVAYKINRGIFLWAGYGFFSKKSQTPVLQLETKSSQQFLSGGIGYMSRISPGIEYIGDVGIFNGSYKEESMGIKLTGSALGFRIDSGLLFRVTRMFFAEMSIGYLSASDTIDDEKIKIGGFRAGVGLGARF
jgi:hypothetical protein